MTESKKKKKGKLLQKRLQFSLGKQIQNVQKNMVHTGNDSQRSSSLNTLQEPLSDCEQAWKDWTDSHVNKEEPYPKEKKADSSRTQQVLQKNKNRSIQSEESSEFLNDNALLRKRIKELEQSYTRVLKALKEEKESRKQHTQLLYDEIEHWKTLFELECDASKKEQSRSQRFLEERNRIQKEHSGRQTSELSFKTLTHYLKSKQIAASLHGDLVQELIQIDADKVLQSLYVTSSGPEHWFDKYVLLSCGHPLCEEELLRKGALYLVPTEQDVDCSFCSGSDNRRAFLRMVRICKEQRLYKMVVVGGSPEAHAEMIRLAPPGFIYRIVTGDSRRTKKQAMDDLHHADLVVVWGSTFLPHKLSELYTRKKLQFSQKVITVVHRGLSSFAKTVIRFVEGESFGSHEI